MEIIPLLIVAAERVGVRHFITFHSLLLTSPSLNSSSLQHIRVCDSESLQRSIQPRFIRGQGEMFCCWRLKVWVTALAFGTRHPDRGDDGRKGRPVAMKTAATKLQAALVWLYCHLMARSLRKKKKTTRLTDGDDYNQFMTRNRINHFERENMWTSNCLAG